MIWWDLKKKKEEGDEISRRREEEEELKKMVLGNCVKEVKHHKRKVIMWRYKSKMMWVGRWESECNNEIKIDIEPS